MLDFATTFEALTGNPPFPWQRALYDEWFSLGKIPQSCNLPTGLGKTSVIAIWLIALANHPDKMPRRLVYVVNRRTVVDQTTDEVEKYKKKVVEGIPDFAVSTLRGQFADNRQWSEDPSRPAVICGTVDMIGSRLLFSGYGTGLKAKPLHAGFLGQDTLLIHDEAHLEPAFQTLIETIRNEQARCRDFRPMKVMELTATSRGTGAAFELTKSEREIPANWEKKPKEPIKYVWQRLKSKKALAFVPSKLESVAKLIGETARNKWANSGKSVLVFVRTIDDVKIVCTTLADKRNGGVDSSHIQMLTGTLRGLERDRLATSDEVFARFMPEPKVKPKEETVYLVCTSAGEVGVDISADHMVCDLTTLDSMAQRFGRVNRRGEGAAEIDVIYETDPDPKKTDSAFELARWRTKVILERLAACDWIADRQDASPLALAVVTKSLTEQERDSAFAPKPTLLSATDMLFDVWALTTIKGKLPGRPPVEPYLHGLPTEWQPPETQVAWREEVGEIIGDLLEEYEPADLLEIYSLKPHELLKEPSYRAFKHFEAIAKRRLKENDPVWLVDDDGSIEVLTVAKLADKNNKEQIEGKTVLLSPSVGGLEGGMLNGGTAAPELGSLDVADEWFINDREGKPVRQRKRLRNSGIDDDEVEEMHSVLTVRTPSADEDAEEKTWEWFVVGNEGDKSARQPVLWEIHVKDVEDHAKIILDGLQGLPAELRQVVEVAAKFHDHGKRRKVFQTMLGNSDTKVCWAKSGKRASKLAETYRHEFGSLFDIANESDFKQLDADQQELVLHLIATHHGRARPHFPADEAFDPDADRAATEAMAVAIPRRFARLQRKYGRWGLAYLESLLRAADWAASAKPSKFLEENGQ